jgi:Homeodomain-like domain
VNRLAELPRCENCGASLFRHRHGVVPSGLCEDCKPKPRGPRRVWTVRKERVERTRVLRAQGLTDQQIAAVLGVCVETVRNRLKKAREQGLATQRGSR